MTGKPTYKELEQQIQELKQAELKQKSTEEALRESEAKMRSIFLAAPVGIGFVINRVFREVNSRFCEITGYRQDELIGNDARMIYLSDEDYEHVGKEKYRQIEQTGTGAVEARLKRKDGGIVDVLIRSTPLDPNDPSVGVTFTVLNITERKAAEKALQESESAFRSLFDNHAAVKLIIDPDTGRIVSANHAAEAYYGWSRETLAQMKIQQINTTPPNKIKNLMADAKDQKRIHFEFRHRLADGSIRDVEVFSSGVEISGQHYLHSIIHDITERKKAEKEMDQLQIQNWQLKKAESLTRMAGAIAHHFNNHMMGILGNLELSIEVMKQGESPEKNITEAIKVARKASEVSGLMLTYLGQRTTRLAPMDLGEACRTNLPFLEATLPVNISIKVDLPPSGPMISGNANQIQQLISNLVTNAGESYEGEGIINLSVKTVSAGDIPRQHRYPIDWHPESETYACLDVVDSGCGIPKQDIEKIFDPFFSTKSPGRGLDLPVALGIVKVNKGVIAVKSNRGEGSTFSFFIPVKVEPARQPDQGIAK